MKKILFLLLATIAVSTYSFAAGSVATPANNDYFINDQQVEQLFEKSVDVSLTASDDSFLNTQTQTALSGKAFYAGSDKNFVAAILLNFFLGGLGIHRLYLGTKTLTWVGYILTCGGIFGVVPLVDFIVLIIHNDDLGPYTDNTKFFMWGGGNM